VYDQASCERQLTSSSPEDETNHGESTGELGMARFMSGVWLECFIWVTDKDRDWSIQYVSVILRYGTVFQNTDCSSSAIVPVRLVVSSLEPLTRGYLGFPHISERSSIDSRPPSRMIVVEIRMNILSSGLLQLVVYSSIHSTAARSHRMKKPHVLDRSQGPHRGSLRGEC